VERQLAEEKLRQQTVMADLHYEKSLLKYRGLIPMKKLVHIGKEQEQTAVHHYTHTLKR